VEEEQVDQVNAKTDIMELEHKFNAEQTNHANEKALLMSEIDTLQVQVDYLRSNTSATEKQVMELQNAMERLLGKQMDIEKKYSVATSNLAKLQAENGALDQEKRNLEEYLKQSVIIEKNQKQEISRLSDMLENYSDHNTILKSNVKSLTANLASRNEDIKEMTKNMNSYGKNFQEFCKDLEVQIEQMKIAAHERELVLEEVLRDKKEKNDIELAGLMEFLKSIQLEEALVANFDQDVTNENVFSSPKTQMLKQEASKFFSSIIILFLEGCKYLIALVKLVKKFPNIIA
jgi:chromosome segregation ATPase